MYCDGCGKRLRTANVGMEEEGTIAEVLYSAQLSPVPTERALKRALNDQSGVWDAEPTNRNGQFDFWHMVEVPIGVDPMEFVEHTALPDALRDTKGHVAKVDITHVEGVNIKDHGRIFAEFNIPVVSRKGRWVSDRDARDLAAELSGTLGSQHMMPDVEVDLGYSGERKMYKYHDEPLPVLGGYAEMRAVDELMDGKRPDEDEVRWHIQETLADYAISLFSDLNVGETELI